MEMLKYTNNDNMNNFEVIIYNRQCMFLFKVYRKIKFKGMDQWTQKVIIHNKKSNKSLKE